MTSADEPVRVLIAEPGELHAAILRRGLADHRFAVEVYAGAGRGLLNAARGARVLVIGPTMPRVDLPPIIPQLVAAGSRLLIVADSGFDEVASTLLLAGASGFLSMADSGLDDLGDAVLAISGGASALNPDVVDEVLQRWREQRAEPPPEELGVAALTAREADVLKALSEGLTNRLIARRLGVAEKTVEAHKSRLFVKLGVRNQAQAVGVAVAQGLL